MKKDKIIYALGFFDGVHLGHQALLTACKSLAKRFDCEAGVVTFASHPDALVTGRAPLLINTEEERQRILLGHSVAQILVLPFDDRMMHQPWQAFLEELMEKGAAGFVCGDDFRFGYRGEGTSRLLADFCRERGMPWAIVPPRCIDGVRVSSTHIRGLLEAGEMEQAVRFLGHSHVLSGTVVKGKQLGRTIGIPTANLELPEGVVCPAFGVYACKTMVDGAEYMAVTNVGVRPTVSGSGITVEPWILDFEGDLYGRELTLEFYAFLRPEKKFDTMDALRQEIRKNALKTRDFFGKMRK